MSRKTIYSLLACLLSLLPTLTQAQSLTRYEYWFDDDFGGRVIKSMSGTDKVVTLSLSTDQLDYGVHKFSFRARQSGTDYPYTAITSSLFLKRPAAQNSTMEYWFDDNFDQRDVMDISSTEDEQEFTLDLRDNSKYPWGFHKLNMRITLKGGGESAVYSSGVLKLAAGKATTLECWVDGNRENIIPIEGHLASDGQDYLFVSDLDLSDIPYGLHRLHCRAVSNSGKTVTAVSSSLFLKRPAAQNSTMEYWFDDNFDQRDVMDISNTEDEQEFSLDLRDNSKYPWGFHKLNMRITLEGGGESTVYSSPVLKLSAGKANTLEYWLDGDRSNMRTLSGSLASDGKDYLFVDDLDMSDVSPGLHRLYCRAVSNSGKTASAVTSEVFLKLPTGNVTTLECWLDGDRRNIIPINGHLASDGKDYLFVNDLNLGAVTPGHHRLYCRAVGNSGQMVTAVTSTAIMVKPRYSLNDEYGNPNTNANAKIVCYSLSIDEADPVTHYLDEPKYDYLMDETIDASFLDDGEHELAVTFWNDLDNSVTDKSNFIVDINTERLATPDPTTFKATDIHETGFTANWTAIEGALLYDIYVYEEGDNDHPVYRGGSSANYEKITGLEPCTSYVFKVRAKNNKPRCISDWSGFPRAVKTKQAGYSTADIVLHRVDGFTGADPMTVNHSYNYNVWVVNYREHQWRGSFELRDGDAVIHRWKDISIPDNGAQNLDCYYTPTSPGFKGLVLYYLSRGIGDGIPVATKEGGDNFMLLDVKADYTYNKHLELASVISCPETMQQGDFTPISTTVINKNEEIWRGTLYIMDNGVVLTEKKVVLSPNESTPLAVAQWTPETVGEHQVGIYYKTNDGFISSLVSGYEFPNPKVVTVEAGEMPEIAMATINHVTNGLVPTEVTLGSEVYYYFRITDGQGNRLRGLRIRFNTTIEGKDLHDIAETTVSDDNGLAVLRLQTEGSATIAERGQTAVLSYAALLNEKNENVQFMVETGDIKLKVHQPNSFSDFTGLENLESYEFAINRGVTAKGGEDAFHIADFNASLGLNFPVSYTRKFKDLADSNPTISLQTGAEAKANADMSFWNCVNLGAGGNICYKQTTTYDLTSWKTPLAIFMGELESIFLVTNNTAIKGIRALESWYTKKYGGKGFFSDIIVENETYDDWALGVNVNGETDILKKIPEKLGWIGGTKLPDIKAISIPNLTFKGSAAFSWEPWKKRYKDGNYLYGKNSKFKGELGGEFNSLVEDLASPHKPWWKYAIGMSDFSNKIYHFLGDTSPTLEQTFAWSWKEEEMYTSEERVHLAEISNTYEIQTATTFSIDKLAKYICGSWADWAKDLKESLSFSVSDAVNYKMSSKGPWLTRMEEYARRDDYYKNIVGGIYPHFTSHFMIERPWTHKKVWEESNLLGKLQAIPSGGEYNLRDPLKISMQNSSQIEGKIKIPLKPGKVFKLTLDLGFSLKFSYFPSETYYSVTDKCFLPVVLRPSTTFENITKALTGKIHDKIYHLFDNDLDDLDKEYDEAGKKIEYEPSNFTAIFENKTAPHIYDTNALRIRSKHPMIAQNLQKDICNLRFTVNEETLNFKEGTVMGFSHYYPAGCQLGITEEGDTLFVISEVCELGAVLGTDTLQTTHQGKMKLETTVGADDLTPFGFSASLPLDVYYSDNEGETWQSIGPAGTTLMVDKLGAYMLATSIRNDVTAPQITAVLNEEIGLMHINVTDNIGTKVNTLQVLVNGEQRSVAVINESNFELPLTAEELADTLMVDITVEDLAGNVGHLYQILNVNDRMLLGDANNDKVVNVTDVMLIVNNILGRALPVFNKKNADVNKDNHISVADVMSVVKIVLSHPSHAPASARLDLENRMLVAANSSGCDIRLEGNAPFTACEMVLSLPEGCTLLDATLDNHQPVSHQIMVNSLSDGRHKVVIYAPANGQLVLNEGPMVNLKLSGKADGIKVSDIMCCNHRYETVELQDAVGMTTDLKDALSAGAENDTYSIQGIKTPKPKRGVFIKNRKKTVVK